jgi:Ser/Thr protein kinase RdoA (MazF antagonist)
MTGAAGRHRRARPLTDNSNGGLGDSANTVVSEDVHVAELALAEYDLTPDSTLNLLNLSENATYAVDDAATGTRSILRVHRQNYHRAHEIESELDWLDALRRDGDVMVPTVLLASDGRRVVTVNVDGTQRHVVHFEMVAGIEPDEATLTGNTASATSRGGAAGRTPTALARKSTNCWTRPRKCCSSGCPTTAPGRTGSG